MPTNQHKKHIKKNTKPKLLSRADAIEFMDKVIKSGHGYQPVDWIVYKNGTFFVVPQNKTTREHLLKSGANWINHINALGTARTTISYFRICDMIKSYTNQSLYMIQYEAQIDGLVTGSLLWCETNEYDGKQDLGIQAITDDYYERTILCTSKDNTS